MGKLDSALGGVGKVRAWSGNVVHVLLGSRFFVALSGVTFITFLAHALNAGDRPPAMEFFNLQAVFGAFLPPPPPDVLPEVARAQAQEAAKAGLPHLMQAIDSYFAKPENARAFNIGGLVVSSIFLAWSVYLLARRQALRT